MSKELSEETKYELNLFGRELNKDLTNLMELLRKQDKDNKAILYAGRHVQKIILPVEEYQKMCQRLETIDNTNPSKAMKCLIGLEKEITQRDGYITNFLKIKFDIIKQALIKAQEQEKVIIELCEYCGMNNLYPYDNLKEIEITFKDTFDNYQLQRITSLGRLNKLGNENAELKRVLEIIKEKEVDIVSLKNASSVEQYNSFISFRINYMDYMKLTQEEFELLKRWTNE